MKTIQNISFNPILQWLFMQFFLVPGGKAFMNITYSTQTHFYTDLLNKHESTCILAPLRNLLIYVLHRCFMTSCRTLRQGVIIFKIIFFYLPLLHWLGVHKQNDTFTKPTFQSWVVKKHETIRKPSSAQFKCFQRPYSLASGAVPWWLTLYLTQEAALIWS